MELTYRQEGNYLIPNLCLDQPQEAPGKYGLLRKRFLKEHQRGIYAGLLLNGTLKNTCWKLTAWSVSRSSR